MDVACSSEDVDDDEEDDGQCQRNAFITLNDARALASCVERLCARDDDRDDDDGQRRRRTTTTETKGESLRTLKRTLERYREQRQLLDEILEDLVRPLARDVLAEEARALRATNAEAFRGGERARDACVALDAFTSVRGWKTCVRFYTNDARDLEPAIGFLKWTSTTKEAGWETRRVALRWISMLALTPFDLVSIDSATTTTMTTTESAAVPRVVHELVSECKKCLAEPGATRDAAAATLAKVLTRPDMSAALTLFFEWCGDALKGRTTNDAQELTFLIPGVLRALAAIYKSGARGALAEHAERCWRDAKDSFDSEHAKTSMLVRQLSVKLATRVGLVFMKPRVASWRYDRGSRCLQDNLRAADRRETSRDEPAILSSSRDDSDFVHDVVDDIVEMLLVGLRDVDTVVRWSAAKGIGRVAARLPRDFGDEVVGAVLECFSVTESDSTWHGACLALAELARRGLLLPSRLAETVPLVVEALTYDVRRGPHSVGTHVRDAACYVSWAFARAYAAEVFSPYVSALAPTLLMVACFDREVNCRRAASAAFQESVGRLGQFPHGIDIVTVADYFSLGSKVHASLTVAPYVCQFTEYRVPMLEHILDVKLTHWERATRQLAVQTVGVLGDLDPNWILDVALPAVIDRACSSDLPTRHGAILAIGEMVLVVHRANLTPSPEVLAQIADVVPNIERLQLYRGKGGELMRGATCRLIECIAEGARTIPLDDSLRDVVLNAAEEGLRCSSVDVQVAGANAIKAFARAYYARDDASASRGVSRLLLTHANVVVHEPLGVIRRGSALILGSMPTRMLAAPISSTDQTPAWKTAFEALIKASIPEANADTRDAETRVNATMSLTDLAIALLDSLSASEAERVAERAIDALLECLGDYSVDKRGDVGSWVREASMGGLPLIIAAVQKYGVGASLSDARATRVFAALLKQASEKIDRTRMQALRTLVLLTRGGVVSQSRGSFVQAAGEMRLAALDNFAEAELFRRFLPESLKSVPDASGVTFVFDALAAPLLKEPAYAHAILSGWFISAGGIAVGLAQHSSDALVRAMNADASVADSVIKTVVRVLVENKHDDRVTLPTLRVCDILISRGCMPQAHAVALALVDAIRGECFSSKDISKLALGATCLAHFVGASAPAVHSSSSSGLLALMVNRYPRVRREAAEQLYMGLLALDEPTPHDALAMEVLSSNSWDAPASATQEARERLYELLHLDLPAFMRDGVKAAAPAKSRDVDENGTYASLVGNAGY